MPREAGAEAVQASLDSGADDVLVSPPFAGVLLARVAAGLRNTRLRASCESYERYGDVLVHIGNQGEISLDSPETLHDILGRIAEAVGWTRAALVLLAEEPGGGLLVSASDHPGADEIPLTLSRYPRCAPRSETREPVLVDDVGLEHAPGRVGRAGGAEGRAGHLVGAAIVEQRVAGALLLRNDQPWPPLPARAIDFLRMASTTLGLILRAGRVFEGLREQTNRMSLARYNEERRNRALDQYKDFFESSSDGMVVLDGERACCTSTAPRSSSPGTPARVSVGGPSPTSSPRRSARRSDRWWSRWPVAPTWSRSTFSSTPPRASRSRLGGDLVGVGRARRGHPGLSRRHRAARARRRAAQDADFLERLIDSTVDGIIAADMRGNVIIFNQGAARLYGYPADEVVGKLPVWRLYPEGVAKRS